MYQYSRQNTNGQTFSQVLKNIHWKRPQCTARPSRPHEATPGCGGSVEYERRAPLRRRQNSVPCSRQLPRKHVAPQTMKGSCCRGEISRGQGFGRHGVYGRDNNSSNFPAKGGRFNGTPPANYVSPPELRSRVRGNSPHSLEPRTPVTPHIPYPRTAPSRQSDPRCVPQRGRSCLGRRFVSPRNDVSYPLDHVSYPGRPYVYYPHIAPDCQDNTFNYILIR